ncbi:12682_t:CDS:1 [Acaulospora colombiana]|uniref:12682_t:CDS:1 n=1 Tax=Acaulospora colombiana TaxID=27376 RepID=A0ACA9KHK3_9GLOM|nr:12682_t:CDS:1 [Acaulospora colombiana]
MLPPNFQITLFPDKKIEKFRDSVIRQIEALERRSFPKNEVMAIKEEMSKRVNKLLIAYYELEQKEKIEGPVKHNGQRESRIHHGEEAEIRIIAYLIYSHVSSKTLPLTKVLKLCVHPSYRRNGLGRMLLEWVFEKTGVPKKSKANLHVDKTREGAVNLYQKVGFKVVEQVIDYYEVGRDALLMEYEESF